jgi:hypothetical protein
MDIFATVAGKWSHGIAVTVGCRDLADIPADESPDGPFGPRLETVRTDNPFAKYLPLDTRYKLLSVPVSGPGWGGRSSSLGRA